MKHVAIVFCCLLLISCQANQRDANVTPLNISFSWDGVAACSSEPPAFVVSGAPAGTASLRFTMVDRNAPAYQHGGGTVTYAGPSIPRGAFRYVGPCPPAGRHTYEWTVAAINAAGKIIAEGTAVGAFPPAR